MQMNYSEAGSEGTALPLLREHQKLSFKNSC